MRDVFEAILQSLEQDQAIVRASVMKSSGSTPRAAGASMAVFPDGAIIGTIGGGLVENASIHAAVRILKDGASEIREFDLTGKDAASQGMVCGGEMTILLDLMTPCDEHISLAKETLKLYKAGKPGVFATILNTDKTVIRRGLWPLGGELPTGVTEFTIPDQARAPFVHPLENGTLFAEPLIVDETVHFIGAGHVAQATARLAATTGFRVNVIDDRAEFSNAARFPDAQNVRVVESLDNCLPDSLTQDDYLVIMTRGHLHDRNVLAQALKTKAGYVGMIGSKKKRTTVYQSLLDNGYTQDDLNRVHCPIGLPIGAETPEQIAVSIMAELIKFRAGI
ncbi:MAG: XdhC family protein [Pseudodesulfovibrio sp.]|nr:XdhC family protein [Pseudodesulfovibrio sp.]